MTPDATIAKSFKITCAIENDRCYETIEKGIVQRFVVGRASGTKIDREDERIAESAVQSFQKAIEDGYTLADGTFTYVPLRSEHQNGWADTLGFLTRAWIDEDHDLWIEAELDLDNPNSLYLFRQLKKQDEHGRPRTYKGLSIGGLVLEAENEWDASSQKLVRTYKQVALQEVSVTSRPAYPTAFLSALNKSIAWDKLEGTHFVMENPMTTQETAAEAAIEKTEAEEVVEAVAKTTLQAEETPEADAAPAGEVEKTEEAVETAEAIAKASTTVRVSLDTWADSYGDDPVGALKSAVESLIHEIESMQGVLKSLSQPVEAEVEKSEPEETAVEPVEKTAEPQESAEAIATSGTEADGELLVKALTDTLAATLDEKLSPLTTQVADLAKRIDEVEQTEVDKSLSVSEAIDSTQKSTDADPLEAFMAETEGMDARERMRKAVEQFGQGLFRK